MKARFLSTYVYSLKRYKFSRKQRKTTFPVDGGLKPKHETPYNLLITKQVLIRKLICISSTRTYPFIVLFLTFFLASAISGSARLIWFTARETLFFLFTQKGDACGVSPTCFDNDTLCTHVQHTCTKSALCKYSNLCMWLGSTGRYLILQFLIGMTNNKVILWVCGALGCYIYT